MTESKSTYTPPSLVLFGDEHVTAPGAELDDAHSPFGGPPCLVPVAMNVGQGARVVGDGEPEHLACVDHFAGGHPPDRDGAL